MSCASLLSTWQLILWGRCSDASCITGPITKTLDLVYSSQKRQQPITRQQFQIFPPMTTKLKPCNQPLILSLKTASGLSCVYMCIYIHMHLKIHTCIRRFVNRWSSFRATSRSQPSSRRLTQPWSGSKDEPYKISVPTEKIPMLGVRSGTCWCNSSYLCGERPVEKTKRELCAYSAAHKLLNRSSAVWYGSVWSTCHVISRVENFSTEFMDGLIDCLPSAEYKSSFNNSPTPPWIMM